MPPVRTGTLAEELVGLARALERMNGEGRSAAVWELQDGARLLYAGSGTPETLLEAAHRRLEQEASEFELHGDPGARGIVHICSIGRETVAYGLFMYGAGRPHLESTIRQLIGMAEAALGKRVADMSRVEKQQVVRFLDDRGAFLIRRAVEDVADRLGVTRFTIYNYLDREH
ncbi:MAG: helix-turn-helix domain-containing protein [Actinomycetota bacterium]